jgi:transcriptional regulator with GAF, ATPase, and Fis domain
VLAKVEKFARFNEPILITGESGVGKELIAKACYLLSSRIEHPFVSVNCPQYLDSNTTISALFGHVRGSFTGAVSDHKGLFETADQGVLFLDEIGDLPLSTQVLLLRALAEGEFKPLGSNETKKFHARFITATNQPLSERMNAKEFREDLFFRLRYFRIEMPPLRDRGDDWRLLLDAYLARLNARYNTNRYFSAEALETLASYRWPGNVRELRGIVSMAYSLSSDDVLGLDDFQSEIQPDSPAAKPHPASGATASGPAFETDNEVAAIYNDIVEGRTSFWESVHTNFMEREINREQVKAIIAHGLRHSMGSYRRLCQSMRIESCDYQKLMDFLRHHRLKP